MLPAITLTALLATVVTAAPGKRAAEAYDYVRVM